MSLDCAMALSGAVGYAWVEGGGSCCWLDCKARFGLEKGLKKSPNVFPNDGVVWKVLSKLLSNSWNCLCWFIIHSPRSYCGWPDSGVSLPRLLSDVILGWSSGLARSYTAWASLYKQVLNFQGTNYSLHREGLDQAQAFTLPCMCVFTFRDINRFQHRTIRSMISILDSDYQIGLTSTRILLQTIKT